MPKKSVIFGQNFQLQSAIKNLPLVERSGLYELVQVVDYYQKILVTYLDHSRNGGGPWTEHAWQKSFQSFKISFIRQISEGSVHLLEFYYFNILNNCNYNFKLSSIPKILTLNITTISINYPLWILFLIPRYSSLLQ